jgi:hypothetical protein
VESEDHNELLLGAERLRDKGSAKRYFISLLTACAIVATGLAVGKFIRDALRERERSEMARAVAALEELGGKFQDEDKGLEIKSSSSVTFGRAASITDADMAQFEKLPDLSGINLNHTRISNDGLVHLKGLGKLQALSLWNTKVSAAGLVHLKDLTALQELDLEDTEVTDEGLEHLRGLTKLGSLNLSGTRVTDAGVKRLAGLAQLKSLGLGRTEITDAGLQHLTSLVNMKSLYLKETKVTDAGVRTLQRALPEARIDR